MIVVVDYRKGNLKSVERGLMAAGADVIVTEDASAIARADAIVLPGVGAFADAAATMRELGQMDVIRARIAEGVPFLGICLGLHLMFEEGIEGSPAEDDEVSSNNASGLAILPGVVSRIPSHDAAGSFFKVPHVGWNTVMPTSADGVWQSPLFDGIAPGEYFYFTHSFIVPDGSFALARTSHSTMFPSAVRYGKTAYGVQFHPEKSSDAGARLLQNFVTIVKGA